MIDRYTRPEMGSIWAEEAKFALWLEVELTFLDALEARGEIPAGTAGKIRRGARYDRQRIAELECRLEHDVIAFLTALAENLGPESRFVHRGMTSSDLLDTALALQIQRGGDLLLKGIDSLLAALKVQALAHKHTMTVGRTHGVHAEPTSLGLKFLLAYDELERGRARLATALAEAAVGKLSGAVGTYAHVAPEVEADVMRRLGIRSAQISTQVVPRDRHAALVAAIAVTGASLERLATEIRNLQRTEIREVEEPFAKGQKGSSSMPHKRNPIISERIAGLARVLRGHVVAAIENIALWHERDITHSSVERIILPDSFILLDYMLHLATPVIEGLLVNPEAIAANLARSGGLVYSQRILLALVDRGLTREQAYSLVQRHAMAAWGGQGSFRELLASDAEVSGVLKPADFDQLFHPGYALKHVDAIYQRVFESDPVPVGGPAS